MPLLEKLPTQNGWREGGRLLLYRSRQEDGGPVQRLGGGGGGNKFVPVLEGNGTKITPTGDIYI